MSVKTRSYERVGEIYGTFKENQLAYLFFLPTLLFIVVILWVPFLRGIWMSFHQWPVIGTPEWIGLDNYRYLFNWDVFWVSALATVIYMTSTVIQVVLGVTAALIVANIRKYKNIVSGMLILPYTFPPVATATLWLYLLDPNFGPIFQYLQQTLGIAPIYWDVYGDTAIAIVTLVSTWTFWPFVFLIVVGARQGISDDQYQAARVYGASRYQMLMRITLPQLKSVILIAFSLRFVWNLVKVSQPLTLTGGGPGYQTSIVGILLYRLTLKGQLGQAYSVGTLIFLISLGAVLIVVYNFESGSGRSGT